MISKYSLNLYLHIMLIILLINRRKLLSMNDSEVYVLSIKLFVVYLICNNLSANGILNAYRIGILAMYIPIALSVFPVCLKKIWGYILVIIPL